MKKKLEILWEGYLPITNVLWKYNPSESIILSDSTKKECEKYWTKLTEQYPNIYDGTLLSVNNIDYQENDIIFHLGNIRYSELSYHCKNNLQLEHSIGSLGFQALIYNLSHTDILIGQRASTSDYRPNFYGTPGGIFEAFDVKGTIRDACIREIQEEIFTAIKPESMRLLAIFREESFTAVGLIIEIETLKDKETTIIKGNEEWQGNQLQWLPVSKLIELKDDTLMDSLIYVKYL